MFNRNDAFSMEISDPDSTDESEIIKKLVIDDELLIFKTDGIYKVLTVDTIDLENEHADTRHSHEKLFDIGTSSIYVSRIIIQFEKIINSAYPSKEANELISHVWNLNKLILNCYSSVQYLKKNNEKIKIKCDDIIERYKDTPSIPALPQIEDLENKVCNFLGTGKKFLVELFRLFELLFQMPIKSREEAHFDNHIKWINERFGKEHALSIVLDEDKKWMRILSECRNAIEHKEEGQYVSINNFKLIAGNKLSEPTWTYDLTKKLKMKKLEESNLINDLEVFVDNMLYSFEEIMLLILEYKLKDTIFQIYKLSEESMNINCPILYNITLKTKI